MQRIKVLVVDDSLTIRAMIETLLENDEDFDVVGHARNADEAFSLIEREDPDVITLDVAMPGMNGMEILDKIMREEPRPVIMLSSLMREGDIMVDTALERGALACFNKNRIIQEAPQLIAIIKQVAVRRPDMKPRKG
jgi:chemotaxis response regulator CheB